MKNNKQLGSIAFMLFGAGMISLGLIILNRSMSLIRTGQRTTGTVVQLATRAGKTRQGKLIIMYTPVFEFTTLAGEKERYTHAVSTSRPDTWNVGDTATLVYDMHQPRHIMVLSSWTLYLPFCVLGLFGMIFLLAGGIRLFLSRKAGKKTPILPDSGAPSQ
jgi:Protein of unknown function (DUF3592)